MSNTITIDAVLIDKVSGVVGKMNNAWTEFNSAMQVAAAAGRLAGQVYDATVKKTMAYADSVRALTDVSSASAEQASRFIQVLDDYQITAQDALTATKALTRQGHEPTLDTLAKLSTEYNSLTSEQAKNEFILKNLGKAGLEWARVLGLGEDAIRKLSTEVDKNLVLSQKQLDAAEDLRLAQDELNDTYQALAVTVGNDVIPKLTDYLQFNERIRELAESDAGFVEKQVESYKLLGEMFDNLFQKEEVVTTGQLGMMYATQAVNMEAQAHATNTAAQAAEMENLTLKLANGTTAMGALNQAISDLKAFKTADEIADIAGITQILGEKLYDTSVISQENIPVIYEMLYEVEESALGAKSQIEGVRNQAEMLDGLESHVWIYIHTVGGMPSYESGGGVADIKTYGTGDYAQYGGLAKGGPAEAYSMHEVVEEGPEMLNVGGKSYLMMGSQGGQVEPMKNASGVGGGGGGMSRSNARMIGKEIAAEIVKALG